jgi:hypothetical protein
MILCALSPWTSPPAVSPHRRPSFQPASLVVLKIQNADDDRYPAPGPDAREVPLTSERATLAAAPGRAATKGLTGLTGVSGTKEGTAS